jgi:hypothetical protein
LDPDLVAWWKLDEADGVLAADFVCGRDGVLSGNPVWQPFDGWHNGALQFDGRDDYVEAMDDEAFDLSESITLCAWVKISSVTKNWRTIVSKGANAWQLLYDSHTDRIRFKCAGVGSMVSRVKIEKNEWHHVAATYDGASLSVYVDGSLAGQKKAKGLIGTNDDPVSFGGVPICRNGHSVASSTTSAYTGAPLGGTNCSA